jgi:hypothetical protein
MIIDYNKKLLLAFALHIMKLIEQLAFKLVPKLMEI